MRVVSFFAGCGGLDLGFKQAGFDVVWANEFDRNIHATYRLNHPSTTLCEKDLRKIEISDIPDADGFIGGPPCQSWSVGGSGRGLHDERGQLFLKYIEIIKQKHPKFFVIENVFGMLTHQHISTFLIFIDTLEKANYNVYYAVLNAADYRIPQDRKRVFVIGFSSELNCQFSFPKPENYVVSLRQAIGDITENPQFYSDFDDVPVPQISNHDVYMGPFDAKFMARNRVRSWDKPSFTIQAQAKNVPLHPQAPAMRYVSSYQRIFEPGYEHLYRRLSVRECARIQTFPDSFKFIYSDVKMGYKMVGNAVPPRLAKCVALSIKKAFEERIKDYNNVLVAYYHNERQLKKCEVLSVFYFRASLDINAYNPLTYLPPYLILARGKKRILYEIDQTIKTVLVSREYLLNLGFIPHSSSYWIIRIKRRLCDISDYKTKWKDKRKRSPYLDFIGIKSL
ncbi:MAG: DNA cytosine methyltransferase [Muribaculaceae bacterium]|nr:DNA cytosine methyltransferase [Muribaculaceae bacterium]